MMNRKTKRGPQFLVGVLVLLLVAAAWGHWDPEDGFKMHYPQLPDPSGWDVCLQHLLLADDFACSESGLITEIHFWISWKDDLVDLDAIAGWEVSIWSDANGKPGRPLWHYRQGAVAYRPVAPSLQGWLCPCGEGPEDSLVALPENHTQSTQVNITEIEDPFFQQENQRYWLVARALVPEPVDDAAPAVRVGWKTTIEQLHWGAGALWSRWPSDAGPRWRPILGPDGEPEHLAFVINGREAPPMDFGDTPEDRCNDEDPTGVRCCRYPTTLACNGARHVVVPAVYLGDPLTDCIHIDAEPDGQPSAAANGDDVHDADDEDGVMLPEVLIAGQTVEVEILASVAGFIDAWIDANGDGDWNDLGERIFYSQPVAAGSNTLTFVVPAVPVEAADEAVLQTYARFRYSTRGHLNYFGAARDGEVEDYLVRIVTDPSPLLDFGDAPDGDLVPGGYPTLLIHNGARHRIRPGVRLGGHIDPEPDGQPTEPADGDDLDADIDDEDGVIFPGPLVQGQTAEVWVIATTPGWLYGCIDWNHNQSWAENADQVFAGQWLHKGVNHLEFDVPAVSVAPYATYARFRFTTTEAVLSFNGPAGDGEVEDYLVRIEPPQIDFDYGDAPDETVIDTGTAPFSYPTRLCDNGARHRVAPEIYLGDPDTDSIHIDAEPNGLPTLAADGDDTTGADDEDGIEFLTPLVPGFPAKLLVLASVDGYLDAWIDFNADGDWGDFREHIFSAEPVAAGSNSLAFEVPPYPHAVPADLPTYARFRFSTYGRLGYAGPARNGEVEDYRIRIEEPPLTAELGDAPDSSNSFAVGMTAYPSSGVLPVTVPAHFPTVYRIGSPPYGPIHWHSAPAHLGVRFSVESEADFGFDEDPSNNLMPQPDKADLDKADDGVRVPLVLPPCRPTRFGYVVTVTRPIEELYVNVWFDWNRDGDWDDVIEACPDATALDPADTASTADTAGPAARAREWAVRNQVLIDLAPGVYRFQTPRFLPWHPLDGTGVAYRPIWMRITLSERAWHHPILPEDLPGIGGAGPRCGYWLGETEDYYFVPKTYPILTADLDGNGIVNLADLAIMAGQWLDSVGNP
ncbi:MAG: hypothetical protein JW810_12420 [Sedimentisphaerales bacterium]|nr:hypothetical protein [Sedimentisphaerales bacterium]